MFAARLQFVLTLCALLTGSSGHVSANSMNGFQVVSCEQADPDDQRETVVPAFPSDRKNIVHGDAFVVEVEEEESHSVRKNLASATYPHAQFTDRTPPTSLVSTLMGSPFAEPLPTSSVPCPLFMRFRAFRI